MNTNQIVGLFSILFAAGLTYAASGNIIQIGGHPPPDSPKAALVLCMIAFQILAAIFFAVIGVKMIRTSPK